jgi:hypothetical protein
MRSWFWVIAAALFFSNLGFAASRSQREHGASATAFAMKAATRGQTFQAWDDA